MIRCHLFLSADRPRLTGIGGLGNAHQHHSGTQFVKHREDPVVKAFLAQPDRWRLIETEALHEVAIRSLVGEARQMGLTADLVNDPSYPVLDRMTVECLTAGWVLLDPTHAAAAAWETLLSHPDLRLVSAA